MQINNKPPRLPKGQPAKIQSVRNVPMDQVRVPGKKSKSATPAAAPTPPPPGEVKP